jgi:hypothetical protein
MDEKPASRTKWYIIGGVLGALIVLGLIIFGLYMLGDDTQSALEKFRDIAVIFIVLLLFLVTVLLAGITAGLLYLVLQIKDRVIPALEELTASLKRVKGTTDFVTEEAVKPIISVASSIAGVRAMAKTFTERPKKKK